MSEQSSHGIDVLIVCYIPLHAQVQVLGNILFVYSEQQQQQLPDAIMHSSAFASSSADDELTVVVPAAAAHTTGKRDLFAVLCAMCKMAMSPLRTVQGTVVSV
jgi:hypothetical protein